jgi:rhodanese-related sulfurtransferase
MGKLTEILQAAQTRAKSQNLPYAGALLPYEAYTLMCEAPAAKLVDVRSQAERELVGTIAGAIHIDWLGYPGWVLNPHFLTQFKQAIDPESLVMFLCRSGARSHHAAIAAVQAGYPDCYNVLEGLEGDLDKTIHQRGKLNGWKAAGLPWQQT